MFFNVLRSIRVDCVQSFSLKDHPNLLGNVIQLFGFKTNYGCYFSAGWMVHHCKFLSENLSNGCIGLDGHGRVLQLSLEITKSVFSSRNYDENAAKSYSFYETRTTARIWMVGKIRGLIWRNPGCDMTGMQATLLYKLRENPQIVS